MTVPCCSQTRPLFSWSRFILSFISHAVSANSRVTHTLRQFLFNHTRTDLYKINISSIKAVWLWNLEKGNTHYLRGLHIIINKILPLITCYRTIQRLCNQSPVTVEIGSWAFGVQTVSYCFTICRLFRSNLGLI